MKRIVIILLLLVSAAIGTFTVTAQAPAEKQTNFLSALKEGQQVSVGQDAGRYEITTVAGVVGVQGHKVTEIGNDFIVVQDIAGVTESRIPLWSIKAIVRLKVSGK